MSQEYEYTPREDRHFEAPSTGPSGSTPFKRLRGPVGIRRGTQVANHADDQRTVMSLLDNVRVEIGGNRNGDGTLEVIWPLVTEGVCHTVLWAGILRFQNYFYTMGGTQPPPGALGFAPDGVIDPGGRTEFLLKENRGQEPPYPATSPKELAKDAIPLAKAWAEGASTYLLRYKIWRMGRRVTAFDDTAARVHLHLDRLGDDTAIPRIDEWMENYVLIIRALQNAERVFVRATRDEALAARLTMNCWGHMVPAWARPNMNIWFGPDMLGLGPKCRAAILLHEAGHYIRPKIGHQGGERGFAYDNQSPDQALTSAYVCANFATHAATGRDERFGLARPSE